MSSFVSNVVDKDEVLIDCSYIGFHYETGNTSDVHVTENMQVSFDNEDADWDGTAVVFPEGDTVLLHLWTDTACAVVRLVSDGSNSYTQPIQLLECQAPSVTLNASDSTIGTLTVSSSSSDQYQWEYEGTTHYHKADWYGKTLCDSVGITSTEYDYGEGWVTDANYEFTSYGEYEIKVRVTNSCGLEAIDSKTVKITKNKPTVTLSNLVAVPKVNEDTTVTVTTNDPDTTVVSQTWFIDGIETDTLVHSFDEVSTHEFKVVTVWNDGFEDHVFETILPIQMEAAALIVDLEYVPRLDTDNVFDFTTDVVLGDAPVSTIRYVVSYKLPMSGELVQIASQYDDEVIEMTMSNTGEYHVEVIVTDELGVVGRDTEIVIVECGIGTDAPIDVPVGGPVTEVYVNIGSVVSGDIEVIDPQANVEVVEVSGVIEDTEVSGDVVEILIESNIE